MYVHTYLVRSKKIQPQLLHFWQQIFVTVQVPYGTVQYRTSDYYFTSKSRHYMYLYGTVHVSSSVRHDN